MTADKVEVLAKLLIMKAIVAAEADVQANDVLAGATGAEAGQGIEPGNGVAHGDAVDLPDEGVACSGIGDELLSVIHGFRGPRYGIITKQWSPGTWGMLFAI